MLNFDFCLPLSFLKHQPEKPIKKNTKLPYVKLGGSRTCAAPLLSISNNKSIKKRKKSQPRYCTP